MFGAPRLFLHNCTTAAQILPGVIKHSEIQYMQYCNPNQGPYRGPNHKQAVGLGVPILPKTRNNPPTGHYLSTDQITVEPLYHVTYFAILKASTLGTKSYIPQIPQAEPLQRKNEKRKTATVCCNRSFKKKKCVKKKPS